MPVQVRVAKGESVRAIEQIVAILITKAASMLTVGGNLRPEHPIEIARMLLKEFPYCSLDDFKLLLQRGVMGRYGKILRFDVAVIFGWANAYMDEWAEEHERMLAKEKAKPIEILKNTTPETEKLVDSFLEKLSDFKKIPALTEDQIWEMGKERRAKRGVTLARQKFTIEGMEVSADTEDEARRMYEAFKRKM